MSQIEVKYLLFIFSMSSMRISGIKLRFNQYAEFTLFLACYIKKKSFFIFIMPKQHKQVMVFLIHNKWRNDS